MTRLLLLLLRRRSGWRAGPGRGRRPGWPSRALRRLPGQWRGPAGSHRARWPGRLSPALLLLPLLLAAVALAQTPPSLLSRGLLAEFPRSPAPAVFRPFVGLMSGYDSGPLTTSLDRAESPFHEVDGGLAARRSAPGASVRLDYQFGLRHYARNSRLDRSNHALNLDARFRLSRRVTVLLRDVGSSSSFGDSFQSHPADAHPLGFFTDGGPEVFHSRTVANTALADLIVALSARTSVSVAGDGFLVERQHRGLADALGWRARADLAHRYARHRTLTFSSAFTRFHHTRSFGGADYAVYAVGHSTRLGKHAELDLLAGVGRLRSAGVRPVLLDPEIARLLGSARGAEIFRLDTWTPHVLAGVARAFGRAEVRLQYARSVSDGGGLTGVARQNHGSLAVSVSPARNWRFSGTTVLRTFRSLDTLLVDSTTAAAGGALFRRLGSRAEVVARYQYSFYDFQRGLLGNFHRHQLAAGVVYHFQDLPPVR